MRRNATTRIGISLLVALVLASSVVASSVAARAETGLTQTCIDVRIGNDRSSYLDCLNAAMAAQVAHEQTRSLATVPYDGRSAPNQIGGFNLMAAQEHMGNALGVSATPQRPRTSFASPLTAH